jgi:hypothetical protein
MHNSSIPAEPIQQVLDSADAAALFASSIAETVAWKLPRRTAFGA